MVAARYVKSESWEAAIDILFNVASSLLKAGQGGSGGDLSLFLVDVYKQAELKPDSSNKGKLLTLLRLFDSEEPTRKKFIDQMIGYALPLPFLAGYERVQRERANFYQMVCEMRGVPSWRTGITPCRRITICRRTRCLRRRKTSYIRNEGFCGGVCEAGI